jgi:hypothetical protein
MMPKNWETYEASLDKVQELSLQENALLRAGHFSHYADLLEQKRILLAQLQEGLVFLRSNASGSATTTHHQKRLQEKLIKLLLLERENEERMAKR